MSTIRDICDRQWADLYREFNPDRVAGFWCYNCEHATFIAWKDSGNYKCCHCGNADILPEWPRTKEGLIESQDWAHQFLPKDQDWRIVDSEGRYIIWLQ